MTAPRQVLRGTTYLLSRRCSERRFFLRPSPIVDACFRYLLAVACQRYGIVLHAVCALSDHFHAVVTDPGACLPAFEQFFDSLLARSLNALHGHWEAFWAPGSYSAVTLTTPEAILEKVAYVLANPVKAGLVRRGAEWPGVWSSPDQIGAGPMLIGRPDHFFRPEGPLPPSALLEFTCPPGFSSLGDFRDRLREALTALEDQAARALASEGRSFLGVRKVLAQKPSARASSVERRRSLSPRVAGRDRWKRIEALSRLKDFLRAYREAWLAFAAGRRGALFPEGTYWMRVAYGVACATSG